MMKYLLFLSVAFLAACTTPQPPLEAALSEGSDHFQKVLKDPKHEVQIIYGEIRSDTILHHYYQVDPNRFFYPASTVKMLAAFAAVEQLSTLDLPLQTEIRIDSQQYHPYRLAYDSLYGQPVTVEHLLEKIFVYSDNQAYNILYRWMGKDDLNASFQAKGLDTRVIHLLSESAFSFPAEANSFSYATKLIASEGAGAINTTATSQSWQSELNPKNQIKGLGYIDGNDSLVNEPFDFTPKNFVPLEILLGVLERAVKPELFQDNQRYQWEASMYESIAEIMKLRPRDLPHPIDTLPDNYVKFFHFGDQEEQRFPEHIEIRNKVGWAYGYLTDIAYVRDHKEEIEFFLAATIHVNENEIYNDGVYEYEEVGLPFLAELGRLVYDYEVSSN